VTTLIGLAPGEWGAAALHLGAMLARSAEEPVVVATIVPAPWPPSPYRSDAEFLHLQEQAGLAVLASARTQLGRAPAGDYVLRRARSVPAGLLQVAQEHGAGRLVLGSSASGGYGRVTLGGVADRLLHTAEAPLALAPAGFTAGPGARVRRVTVAFGRGDGDSELLSRAASVAARLGASLRVACFAVRPVNVFSGSVSGGADSLIAEEWVRGLKGDITRALARAASSGSEADRPGAVTADVPIVVGQGESWPAALAGVAWERGDVLAIGTSTSVTSRLFLGSHAVKIVRSSPVPVVLTSRGQPVDR
jgi:nucleotide-binding universal stress UspA family protein